MNNVPNRAKFRSPVHRSVIRSAAEISQNVKNSGIPDDQNDGKKPLRDTPALRANAIELKKHK